MNKTINPMAQEPEFNPVAVFEISGEDALPFLNNQTVSDITNQQQHNCFTAICNPKGRILYTCILKPHDEGFLVAVDASLGDNFLQYIQMRQFRMKFSIKKSTFCLHLDHSPQRPQVETDVTFNRDPKCAANEMDLWSFMFKAGLPWITAETAEQFIPQHVNLDQHGIIAFDKGCYPGQEIVARLHFLGKVKKRMQLIHYEATAPMNLEQLQEKPEFSAIEALSSPHIPGDTGWLCQAIVKT